MYIKHEHENFKYQFHVCVSATFCGEPTLKMPYLQKHQQDFCNSLYPLVSNVTTATTRANTMHPVRQAWLTATPTPQNVSFAIHGILAKFYQFTNDVCNSLCIHQIQQLNLGILLIFLGGRETRLFMDMFGLQCSCCCCCRFGNLTPFGKAKQFYETQFQFVHTI